MALFRRVRVRRDDEVAVSDVIGSILLVGITVLMAGAFGAVLLSYDGPSDRQHTQLSAVVGPGADGSWTTPAPNGAELTITHLGGEDLNQGDVSVIYTDSAGQHTVTPTFTGRVLHAGETWTQAIAAAAGASIDVTVVVRETHTTSVISTGTVSAGSTAATLSYVTTGTAAAGWGSVGAIGPAQVANDGVDTLLQEGAVTGTTTTSTYVPSTGTATQSGASNTNIKLDDNVRASLDVAGDYVQGNKFPNNAGGVAVTDLVIGFQGSQTRTCQSILISGSPAENSASSGSSVSTLASGVVVTAGATYVAVIVIGNSGASPPAAPDVTAVGNLILPTSITWTQQVQTPTLTGPNRLEVWVGLATVTGVETVRATFASNLDTNARATLSVAKFTGVDTSSPIEGTPVFNSGTSNTATTSAISGTPNGGSTTGRFFGAINGFTSGAVTWGGGVTERSDFTANSRARLSTGDLGFTGSTIALNVGLSGSIAWQATAFALKPACSLPTTATLSYYRGANPGTVAQQTFQLTGADAYYEFSIISDSLGWAPADLDTLGVRVSLGTAVSQTTSDIDLIYITLTTSNVATQYRADFELQFNNVASGAAETVQLRYKTNGADTFQAWVWNGAWRVCPGILNAVGSYGAFSCTLTLPGEHAVANPNVRMRIMDSTPTGGTRGTISLDYARVAST